MVIGNLNTQGIVYFKILLVNNLELWPNKLVNLQYFFLLARWKKCTIRMNFSFKIMSEKSLHIQKCMKSCMTTYGIFYTKAEAFEICSSFWPSYSSKFLGYLFAEMYGVPFKLFHLTLLGRICCHCCTSLRTILRRFDTS